MKKPLLIIGSALILTGCQQAATTELPSDSNIQESQLSSLVDSQAIAAAIESGQALNCTVNNKTDGTSFSYSVKGEQFRAENLQYETEPGQSAEMGNVISTGEYFYTWTTPSNKGVKMKYTQDDTLDEQYDQLPDFSDPTAAQEYEENYSLSCSKTNLSDSYFTPPAEVEFQDMTAMMEKAMQDMDALLTPEQRQMLESQQ